MYVCQYACVGMVYGERVIKQVSSGILRKPRPLLHPRWQEPASVQLITKLKSGEEESSSSSSESDESSDEKDEPIPLVPM